MDQELRELERRASLGELDALRALVALRKRSGQRRRSGHPGGLGPFSRDVACPACGAPPGSFCYEEHRGRYRTGEHLERIELAHLQPRWLGAGMERPRHRPKECW